MTDLQPRVPYRPLMWTDTVYELQDLLADETMPIYIVGGAVRDAMMGRHLKDVDLATPGDSIAVARKIANTFPNGALFVMDAERGVARALIDTMHGPVHVDVAKFRSEGDSILADLLDRDFTINAMMVDLKADLTQIIDPLNGEQDVAKKQIRRCRAGALQSDPVRAMRAVRQANQLAFRIEPDTLQEVRETVPNLRQTSAERIRDEFFKILDLPRPAAALRIMDAVGLLSVVLPIPSDQLAARLAVVEALKGLVDGFLPGGTDNLASNFGFGVALTQLVQVRSPVQEHLRRDWPDGRSQVSLMMLAVLLRTMPAGPLEDTIDGLRLSNGEKKRLLSVIYRAGAVAEIPEVSDLALHRFWYPLGAAGVDIALLALAEYLGEQRFNLRMESDWEQLVTRVREALEGYYLRHSQVVEPSPVVDGQVLLDHLGIKPGPIISEILTAVREGQVTGTVTTVDDALTLAEAIHGGKSG